VKTDLSGHVTDFGDVLRIERWVVKGRRHYGLTWHLGAPTDTDAADRVVRGVPQPPTGRVDVVMDLMADKKVPLSIQWTDELGNPTVPPAGTITAVYSVDDTSVINLTDNGDGTAVAAAVGVLGTANVHVAVTANGDTFTGDLQVNVVAGLAERISVVAGTPEEVTPDV
jgi:hypothetical protein